MNSENFFNPRAVAVVGASNDRRKVGYALVANLLAGRERRKIFPVSLSEKEVQGLPAFASIGQLPEAVELALLAVRADLVPGLIAECGAKKIPAVIIIAAGFKEIGEAGRALEEQALAAAREHGIRLLGPNCLGVMNSATQLNASFALGQPLSGRIAFLSQSGALGTALFDAALGAGVGFSKFVSLGNEADLKEIEFLQALGEDAETDAILIYLEHLSDGPAFLRLAGEITKRKPIVVLRAGRSERGGQAVASHTGSLAPADAVFEAACRQAGVITVGSIREFFNLAKLFQLGVRAPLTRLCVLTNGGGPAAVTTDLIDLSASLSLANLSATTQAVLRAVLPPMAAVGNPVDIIGDALSGRYADALKALATEPEVDAILFMLTPQMMTEVEATANLVTAYRGGKPLIPVFLGGPALAPALATFRDHGLPNFSFPQDAIEALEALARLTARPKVKDKTASPVAEPMLKMMSFAKTRQLFESYDIALEGVLVEDKSHLSLALNALGAGPYAIKVISADVVHKSESGAVKINLADAKAVEESWREIKAKHWAAEVEGVLVQKMSRGKELIIGLKRDATFGPTILAGLGGIFTEALKDTALRVAPFEATEAEQMLRELKGYPILAGLRGEPPVNLAALAELIVKLAKLAAEHPEVKEIDLNPVMATPDGVKIVDARVMV